MADNNELEKTLWARLTNFALIWMRLNITYCSRAYFLKYISDAFNDLYNKLKAGKGI